jgi:hypothetical protein
VASSVVNHVIPLIKDLEISSIFKDKAREEGVNIIDLRILEVLVIKLLKQKLNRLVIKMKLVEI